MIACGRCQTPAPFEVSEDWEVLALCPACVEVRRQHLERRAEAARRLLRGEEEPEEYLRLLEEF